jgi:hypothetical protein
MKGLFVAPHESGTDAVDGSSTGTRVPKMWALFKASTIRRSYPCKRFRQLVSTSPSRFFRFTAWMLRSGDYSPAVEASLRPGVL